MLIGNKRLWGVLTLYHTFPKSAFSARLAQSVERKALNLVVVGSSPTVGVPVVNWILQSRFQETKAPDF